MMIHHRLSETTVVEGRVVIEADGDTELERM